jgi:dTDP-4-dehydrorhamnose 3,5-epimerase
VDVQFTQIDLPGAYLVNLEPRSDHRGYFARTFCAREFEEHGLNPAIAQCNLSFTHKKGTIRGMHYLVPPARESKLVSCIRGAIYDVIIDMRPDSPTYKKYISVELTAENRTALYIPEIFAHGFQTLADDTEVLSQMSDFYVPGYERGLRYNDPAFNIAWPLVVTEISEKDASWPLLIEEKHP